MAADGRIVVAAKAGVLAIAADGRVTRLAGPARSCEDTSSALNGLADGGAEQARFNEPGRPLQDPDGNIWLADQQGCALRRISPAGEVSTVLRPEVLCNDAVPREDRPILDNLAWDVANGELVAGGARTVARPVHNLYTTVFRIKLSGECRRVLYATKVGKSPAKVGVDGIGAMAVDPRGYVANGDTLRVISVVEPTHPMEVGSCGSLGWARGVAVSGKYVYVADCDSSLRVISVADPTHPVEVGKCPIPNKAVPVVVAGDYAYVGSQDFGLRVISVADPARPTEVGSCGAYYACNLAVMGSYVYVAAGHGQLRVISAVDAAHPVQVGYYYPSSGEILAVAVQGAYA